MRRADATRVYVTLALIVALGAFLRLWNLGGRPFWRDEAWAATALRDHSYTQLLSQTEVPLPPLFAVAAKWVGQWMRPPELSLRLLPALAGCLLLPLAYAVARSLRAPPSLALAATGLCASSLALTIWSRELKHYSLEALASALIAVLVFRAGGTRSTAGRCGLAAAVMGLSLITPWLGYGAVIPLGVLLGFALLRSLIRVIATTRLGPREKPDNSAQLGREVGRGDAVRFEAILAGLGLVALCVSVAALYPVANGQVSDPALVAYTANWYIRPFSLRSWLRAIGAGAYSSALLLFPPGWLAPSTDAFANVALVGTLALGIWAIGLLGLWLWPRRGRSELAVWLLGTWGAALFLALLGRFPFGVARMMLFWAVPMLLAVSAGLVHVWRALGIVIVGRNRWVLPTVALFSLAPMVYVIQQPLRHRHFCYHDFPTLLRTLDRERQPGELVIVELCGVPCVRYYAPDLPEPVLYAPVAAGVVATVGYDFPATISRTLPTAGPRVWVLTTREPANQSREPLLVQIAGAGYVTQTRALGGDPRTATGAAELLLATRR